MSKETWRRSWASVAVAVALSAGAHAAGAAQAAALAYALGQKMARPTAAASRPGAHAREIGWEALAPKDWDPMNKFRATDFSAFSDADPRAEALLRDMRTAWDNAPVVPALDHQSVRIPGFVVPLEQTKAGINEFLLVPYFGSCIHTPAPPSNQIIHVTLERPVAWLTSMMPIWLEGPLEIHRAESLLATSGYRMLNASIAKYEAPVPGEGSRAP